MKTGIAIYLGHEDTQILSATQCEELVACVGRQYKNMTEGLWPRTLAVGHLDPSEEAPESVGVEEPGITPLVFHQDPAA